MYSNELVKRLSTDRVVVLRLVHTVFSITVVRGECPTRPSMQKDCIVLKMTHESNSGFLSDSKVDLTLPSLKFSSTKHSTVHNPFFST